MIRFAYKLLTVAFAACFVVALAGCSENHHGANEGCCGHPGAEGCCQTKAAAGKCPAGCTKACCQKA